MPSFGDMVNEGIETRSFFFRENGQKEIFVQAWYRLWNSSQTLDVNGELIGDTPICATRCDYME